MSRNTAGSYSLPVGNPVVSNTTISSSWANTTFADVATEMSNSLDRQGRGSMLAQLGLFDGTATVPGLAFSSETNSGLYRAGTNDVRLQIAGAQAQKWTASGTTVGALTVDSISVGTGDVTLAGANVASTTAVTNKLSKKNTPKAWACVKTTGASAISVTDGFNIASVALLGAGTAFDIVFAQAMANINYCVSFGTSFATGLPVLFANKATTGFRCAVYNVAGATNLNMNTNAIEIYITVFAQQ